MAVTNPDIYLYRVDAGAWAAVVGTDGFTDTASPTYAGTGDDEYASYNGSTQWTTVDTPPAMPFTNDDDWTIAIRIRHPLSGGAQVYALSHGQPSGNANRIWIGAFDSSSAVYAFVDTGSNGASLIGSTTIDDDTDHVIVVRHVNADGNCYLYLDGGLEDTQALAGTGEPTIPFSQTAIGTEAVISIGDSNWWPGRVYWAAAWSSDIGTTEIAELDDTSWPFSLPAVGGSILPLLNAYYS